MKSLDSLTELARISAEVFENADKYQNTVPISTNRSIQIVTKAIEEKFIVDYSKPIQISENEMQRLKQMIFVFLKEKKDTFNTHYIQLLAWNIHKIKVMKTKVKFGEVSQSFLEYAPNPLLPFSATNKVFSLFYENRIKDTEKVASALLLNYLNNYKYTSARFKNLLRRYLKSIKYSRDIDVYFNMAKIEQYLLKHPVQDREKYLGKIAELLGIRGFTLKTAYFKDVLSSWGSYES